MIRLSAKSKNLNGDARTAGIVHLTRERAVSNYDGTLNEWQSRISNDRPVYACPDCSETAMQFYATDALHADRADSFHCHACGTSWEM